MKTLRPSVATLQQAKPRTITETTRIRGNSLYAIRNRYFRAHPLCAHCEREGRVSRAEQLDHIAPLWNGGAEADSNRQGLCKACHAVKTAEENAERYGK